jgi:hypothetical protein
MQAYIQHLDKIAQELPEDLVIYFSEDKQQHRDFYLQLKQHKLHIESFRQLFYLNRPPLRISVFDAYVRDYLPEHFETQKEVLKMSHGRAYFIRLRSGMISCIAKSYLRN